MQQAPKPLKRIPVAGPSITSKEIEYVTAAVREGWYENATTWVTRFNEAFAKRMGVKYAVATPSCTSAIHLSLAAWNIGPGDEVIVPDITWIGSSAPIKYVGATPVFADIDPDTWCMSPESFEACITPKTKAVIPVDLYGNIANYDAINEIARERGIKVIEDAAQAAGVKHKGRSAGTLGDVGVFSFHGTKTLTTGEGGMFITNDEKTYTRVQRLRDHGRDPGGKLFWNVEVVFRYGMGSLQAALGLAQLERLDELVAKKTQIFRWYEQRLGKVKGIRLNDPGPGVESSYWMSTAIFDPSWGLEKEHVMAKLKEKSIDSRPFFYPLSMLPAYAKEPQAAKAQKRNKVSYAISPYGVNLPCAMSLEKEDVERVSNEVLSLIETTKRPQAKILSKA